MGSLKVIMLGVVTLVIFPLLGFLIHHYTATKPFLEIFLTHTNYALEIFVGILVGAIGGFLGWKIVTRSILLPTLNKYRELVQSLKMTHFSIIGVSVCAGIGEEVFFRGVVQPLPYFGIWITSILFVAIHGYLNPWNWRISIYGVYMTLLIACLGYLTQELGLTTAIIAHTVIDIVLFYFLVFGPSYEIEQIETPVEDF